MMKLRITALALCLSFVLGMALPCALAEDDGAPKLKSTQCALLGDMGSGRILFNIDAYSRREPASLTKIMTLLLAVEAIEAGTASPDDMVTASAACKTGLEHDSSTAYIDRGETMSLRDLLYCAALASANEACNIIAEHVAGSISAFVERMNTRAAELGCSGTHFANTHGMPDDNHYTTARDIFLIACEGMRHQLFAQLVGCREYTTSATNDSPARVLESSNALITPDSPYSDKYVYPGAVGIKTGYTEKAGYCLVSAVQRDGVNVIAVVLGADGDTANKEFDSFADTVTLLDWCFENYSYRSIVERGYPAAAQPIEKDGRRGEITLVCSQEINALAAKELDASKLKSEVTLYAQTLTDVPAEGTELGAVTFSDPNDSTVYGTVTLVSHGEAQFEEPEPRAKARNGHSLLDRGVSAAGVYPAPRPPQPQDARKAALNLMPHSQGSVHSFCTNIEHSPGMRNATVSTIVSNRATAINV